ncbi:MAG: hypothetical protein K2G45_06570 [Lachnospiraceae bacterium]|nr:hypothetical protein [Lachnospiraceae bacterium]
MDNLIIFGVFLFCLLLPLTICSLIANSIPKLRMRAINPYSDKLIQIQDSLNIQPVDTNDIKNIKSHIHDSVGFITFTIFIDILTIIGLISISKQEDLTAASILIYITALGLLSAICLYNGIKMTKVFNNHDSFSKRNGILLKYKELYFPVPRPGTNLLIYQVLIGTYDDNGKPIVFKTEINEFFFRAIQRNDTWSVIMYEGRPACIIKDEHSKITIPASRKKSTTKQSTGRKIAAWVGFWFIIKACVNFAIEANAAWINLANGLNAETAISLLAAFIIMYMFCLGVPYSNYIAAALMIIFILKNLPYNIVHLQILYLAESVIDAIAVCVLIANKAVKEHFQKL